jgi:hypothetical protein
MVVYNNDEGRLARIKTFVKRFKQQSEEFHRLAVAADMHRPATAASVREQGQPRRVKKTRRN